MTMEKFREVASLPTTDEIFFWPCTMDDFDRYMVDPVTAYGDLGCRPPPNDGSTNVSYNSLSRRCKVLHKILINNITPRGGNSDMVRPFEVFIIYRLLKGQPLHLGYIILSFMEDTRTKALASLPFGMLLTRIFQHEKLVQGSEERVRPSNPMNRTTIKAMRLDDQRPAPPPRPQAQRVSAEELVAHRQYFDEKFNALSQLLASHHEDHVATQQAVSALRTEVSTLRQEYGTSFTSLTEQVSSLSELVRRLLPPDH
ncbi:uncharacterized protein LOC143885473 [Tasmannia lanceolata]|uniref:uncharacterized protein LOC143885473 n=1 Tax=Tasmannia lanceolata TaxID=3420 RepID=UPI00406435D1